MGIREDHRADEENSLFPIFTKPNNSADGILADFYKNIMNQLGITLQRFNMLMETFLADPRNGIPTNIKEKSSARGNLRKELTSRGYMTWKVFCKGLRFINVVRFDINITLYHRNLRKTNHSYSVFLEDVDDFQKDNYVEDFTHSSK